MICSKVSVTNCFIRLGSERPKEIEPWGRLSMRTDLRRPRLETVAHLCTTNSMARMISSWGRLVYISLISAQYFNRRVCSPCTENISLCHWRSVDVMSCMCTCTFKGCGMLQNMATMLSIDSLIVTTCCLCLCWERNRAKVAVHVRSCICIVRSLAQAPRLSNHPLEEGNV